MQISEPCAVDEKKVHKVRQYRVWFHESYTVVSGFTKKEALAKLEPGALEMATAVEKLS